MSNKLHHETFEVPPEVAEKIQAIADDMGLTFEEAAKLLINTGYGSSKEKTAVEILYYDYTQSEKYFKAARAVESKYEPQYEKLMEAMSPEARDEFIEAISSNCSDYCLLGFKFGMAAALNIKAETDILLRSKLIGNDR